MKILFFNSCNTWGGGEKWHFEMSTGLHKMGVEVLVFAEKESRLYQELKHSNTPCEPIKVNNWSTFDISGSKKLVSTFKKLDPDAIIMNLPDDLKFAGRAAKKAGIPNIIYRRGSAIPIRNTWMNRRHFKNIITQIIANSEETKRTILAKNRALFPLDLITVIPNGIHAESYNFEAKPQYTKKENEIIFGNFARLSRQKGQLFLIQIAKRLIAAGVKFKILIGGDGELEQQLREQIAKEGLEDHILLLGFIKDASTFYTAIDIFLFPSIWEGFGFSIVEAKLFRKPIVAFNISSNPEVICNNKDGIMVEVNDSDAFFEAALDFANSPAKRVQFGNAGHEDVMQRFTFDKSIQKLHDYLLELVEDRD